MRVDLGGEEFLRVLMDRNQNLMNDSKLGFNNYPISDLKVKENLAKHAMGKYDKNHLIE